jgi:hypothetical protein
MSVAQAFQWFTARDVAELGRVLAPGAMLALVWNRRQPTGVWAIVDGVIDGYRRDNQRRVDAPAMLEAAGCFGVAEVELSPWVRRLDRSQLLEHIESLSWIAAMDTQERNPLLRDVEAVLSPIDEPYQLEYQTEIVFARRR